MRIENELKLGFDDVLIRPKRSTLSSRKEVDLVRSFLFKDKKKWSGIPIVAANMDSVGTMSAAMELASHNVMTCIHKHYTEDMLVEFFNVVDESGYSDLIAYSLGIREEDIVKFRNVYYKTDKKIKVICVDVANGYTENFVTKVAAIREAFPDVVIIAGNVVTAEITEQLILAGADIVKVGIGSGSACTTRIKTGVGYPQLSAISECADAAHGLGGRIMSDGGCRTPGDISKAFCAGADFVMLGGMLAGHVENLTFDKDGNTVFYGMSSSEAMNKHSGGVDSHRTSEGRVVKIQSRGKIENTLKDILGGVRSTCTYIGAKSIKDMSKCATFLRVNKQFNDVYIANTIGS